MRPARNNDCLPFTVNAAYEDYASGLRAFELYQRLARRAAPGLDFRLVLWKFEPLGVPGLLAKAALDAINADMILFSLSGQHGLPPEADSWIGRWHGRTLYDPAIALLLDPEHHDRPPAREITRRLRGVAEKAGLPFFSSANAILPEDAPRVFRKRALQAGAREPDGGADRWGLNE